MKYIKFLNIPYENQQDQKNLLDLNKPVIKDVVYGDIISPYTTNIEKEIDRSEFSKFIHELNNLENDDFLLCFDYKIIKLMLNNNGYNTDYIKFIDIKEIFHKIDLSFDKECDLYSFFQVPEFEEDKMTFLYHFLDEFMKNKDLELMSIYYKSPLGRHISDKLPFTRESSSIRLVKPLKDFNMFEINYLLFNEKAHHGFVYNKGYDLNNIKYILIDYLLNINSSIINYDFKNSSNEDLFIEKVHKLIDEGFLDIEEKNKLNFVDLCKLYFNIKNQEVGKEYLESLRNYIIDVISSLSNPEIELYF